MGRNELVSPCLSFPKPFFFFSLPLFLSGSLASFSLECGVKTLLIAENQLPFFTILPTSLSLPRLVDKILGEGAS
jgi:hypothetical protein